MDDDPRPRIPLHLRSRFSPIADLAAALYFAVDESGPRLPPRRDVARMAGVSEATVSRRFRDQRSTEDALVSRLVAARRATYPPGYASEGWGRWVPEHERDLRDARAWLTCLAFAAYSPVAAEAVREAWECERALLHGAPGGSGGPVLSTEADADAVHAMTVGLIVLRAVDPRMTYERALLLWERVLALPWAQPEPDQRGEP